MTSHTKRPIVIGVRVNEEEFAALQKLANELFRTVPDTLRFLAREFAKEKGIDMPYGTSSSEA